MFDVKHYRIRSWIIAGYALPVFLFLLTSTAVFVNVHKVREEATLWKESDRIADLIYQLGFNVQQLSRAARGYLLEKSEISRQTYEEADRNYENYAAELETVISDEQQRQNYQKMTELVESLDQFDRQLIALVDAGKTQEAIALWRAEKGRELSEAITDILEAMQQRENEIVEQRQAEQENALDSLLSVTLGASVMSLLVAIAVGSWIISRINQRMNEAASTVASSSRQIATAIEEQERTAVHQASSVNQTTTTMDELSASSRQSAQQAQDASNSANEALDLADKGSQAVVTTQDGIESLKSKVGEIAEQIAQLSNQTSEIRDISQLVGDLANQTNMLALNAAVEAVRAGEHGKGFAVVAAEIRKLADRSRQSAQKIHSIVSEIQNSIHATVMVTEEGIKTANEGVRIAGETALAFNGVQEAVNNMAVNNQQIYLNLQQQASAIALVVDAMNNLNTAAHESAEGISQVKLGTQQLNQAAEQLKTII